MSAQTERQHIPGSNEQRREVALLLADHGFLVFRLEPNGKRPAQSGWQDAATADPDVAYETWSEPISGEARPGNIGIVTGRNLVVIDVDVKNDARGDETLARLEGELGPLPATFTVLTPSGGQHLYFEVPASVHIACSVGKLGPGIDIRGAGGYVVGPASVIDGLRYRVPSVGRGFARSLLPADWLARLAGQKPAERPRTGSTAPDHLNDIARAAVWLDDQAPLAIEGSGGDATTYEVAAALGGLCL